MLLKAIFVLLHIITAAAWFGIGLRVASQARLVLTLEADAARSAVGDVGRTVKLLGLFILLTLLFSLIAFFVGGGFGGYGPVYHSSLLVIVLAVGVHYALIRPNWKKLEDAVMGEGTVEDADSARGKLSMGVGITHLLWLILIVLMLWPQYFGPAFS